MDELVEFSSMSLHKWYRSETCLGGSDGMKSPFPSAFSAMGSFFLVYVK